MQPNLQTPRLELVPLGDEHLEWEVELDADAEVMRYLEPRPRTRTQVEAAHERRMAAARLAPGLGFWIGSAGGEFVGFWLLEPELDDDGGVVPGSAELGYRLRRPFWRQGLATEGSRELLRYAFEDAGVSAVFAQTMAVNAGSRGVMAAVGMTHVRSFHERYDEPVAGVEHGEVEYRITCEEWTTRRS